ncbi:MAG: sugar ABC transporter substrate-binding protein [Clostridia bacterium]|nr:sugar ABC transporter substrate-binding protein [Clostridia bacterium]
MKKLLALALALCMLLSITAVAVADEKTVITVTWWGDTDSSKAELLMIEKFNAEHDDIEIRADIVPGDGYGDRLLTSFSSGEGYDIFASGEGDFYKWVGANMPLSLNDLIANDPDWNNEMNEAIYNFGNINGDQYYLVRDYNPLALFYNKDVFDRYNVAYPTADWTWDDAIAAAKELTVAADNTFGFNAQSWEYAALTYFASKGLDIVNEDCTAVEGYLDSPEFAAALAEYVGFSTGDDRISPDAADQDTFGGTSAMFINNKLAMTISGAWDKATFENAGVNYGTEVVPGNHDSYLCASAFAISKNCKNPEAAWEVIKALTGTECSELRFEYTAALPTVDSLLDAMRADYGEANLGILASLNHAIQPVGLRGAIGNPAVTAFRNAFERVQFNDGTVEQILADAVAEVAEAIAE